MLAKRSTWFAACKMGYKKLCGLFTLMPIATPPPLFRNKLPLPIQHICCDDTEYFLCHADKLERNAGVMRMFFNTNDTSVYDDNISNHLFEKEMHLKQISQTIALRSLKKNAAAADIDSLHLELLPVPDICFCKEMCFKSSGLISASSFAYAVGI